MKPTVPLLVLCLAVTSVPALADNDCDVPFQYWQSREAVTRYAGSQGWQVQRIRIDDGCHEVSGRTARGRAFKAKLVPDTLRLMKMMPRDEDRKQDLDRRNERDTPAHIPSS